MGYFYIVTLLVLVELCEYFYFNTFSATSVYLSFNLWYVKKYDLANLSVF